MVKIKDMKDYVNLHIWRGPSTDINIFDLRLLEKPIEPSVVHSSMNAMGHAKWHDVKTTDAFGDLIGRCYYCDDVAAL